MKRLLLFLFACVAFSGCDEAKQALDGVWDDNIKLSASDAYFSVAGGEQTITSEGADWWIVDNITVNDKTYYLYDIDNPELPNPIPEDYVAAEYSFLENADFKEIAKISFDWFTLTKVSKTEIKIEVQPNYADKANTCSLTLQAGNYFDYIRINQHLPHKRELLFKGTYLKGDDLTVGEQNALAAEIEAAAYKKMAFYGKDILRFYSDEAALEYEEFEYKDVNLGGLTPEESAILDSSTWTGVNLKECLLLSRESEMTAFYYTSNYISTTKSLSDQPEPLKYLDVTHRFIAKYPKLERAYVIYQ